jgi:hypothetical protein
MHEHAAVWTQIGYTKSRSVHRSNLVSSGRGILEVLMDQSPVDCLTVIGATNMNAGPFSMSGSTARLGRIAILWRGDETARHSAALETSRLKAVFAALADDDKRIRAQQTSSSPANQTAPVPTSLEERVRRRRRITSLAQEAQIRNSRANCSAVVSLQAKILNRDRKSEFLPCTNRDPVKAALRVQRLPGPYCGHCRSAVC